MGSRGLGQLSYDKGMRILTASQADNVALESALIRQGLLTYALTHDGLEAAQADFKPKDQAILLAEWLQYAEQRVPTVRIGDHGLLAGGYGDRWTRGDDLKRVNEWREGTMLDFIDAFCLKLWIELFKVRQLVSRTGRCECARERE